MATSIDQKNFVKTALRLPPELHAAVHESAQKSGRSYNGELVDRVQRSFAAPPDDDLTEYVKRLQYDLSATKLELTLVAALGATIGRMLKQSVDAIEQRKEVPMEMLAVVRQQAEEAVRVANKYGFDPHKHLQELQSLASYIAALPGFDLVDGQDPAPKRTTRPRKPKP